MDPSQDNWDLDLFPLDLEDDILEELFDLPYLHRILNNDINDSQFEQILSKRSVEESSDSEDEPPCKLRKIDDPHLNPVAHCSKNPPPIYGSGNSNQTPVLTEADLELLNEVPALDNLPEPQQNPLTDNDLELLEEISKPPKPDPFKIIAEENKRLKKYDIDTKLLTIEFREMLEDETINEYLNEVFSELLNHFALEGVNPGDRVGLTILNSSRPDQKPIGVSLRRWDQMSSAVILQAVEAVIQSNEDFFIDGNVQVKLLHAHMDNGGARNRIDNISTFEAWCNSRRSIVVIRNNDNLCLARALVVAKAHADGDRQFKQLADSRKRVQLEKALSLCEEAGVNLVNGGGVEELRKFQDYLAGYKITVYVDRRGREVMFEGVVDIETGDIKYLDLIFGNNHYNTITNIEGVFNCKKYCRPCKYPYDHLEDHKCPTKCICCKQAPKCIKMPNEETTCGACGRDFFNNECYLKHLNNMYHNNKSTCDVIKRCPTCFKIYCNVTRKNTHTCGETYCSVCGQYRPNNHLCFIKKAERKSKPEDTKFLMIFFDLECTQDTPYEGKPNTFEHKPNFCVAQQMCYKCIGNNDISVDCVHCGIRQHIFKGQSTMDEFMTYATLPRLNFSNICVVAHNMKSYDGQFVLKYMTEVNKWTPDVILSGTKIQVISYDRIKVLDSLNFFNDKLSSLPKMFNLKCANKGYFPHFFNTTENWEYDGPLPNQEFYGSDTMKPRDREQFIQWYNQEKTENNHFNLQKDIEKYCIQDVVILREACTTFRTIFLSQNGIDPFLQCVTIASACMLTYRKNYMQPNTIGIIPPGGYRLRDRQSKVALTWLKWMERKMGQKIQHAGNGREALICNYRVDGYLETTNTIFEFQGCWFHGCQWCFADRDTPIGSSPKETMGTRFEATRKKVNTLKQAGYKVVQMWECCFNLQKAQDQDLKKFVEDCEETVDEPLNPRDAFFGGRTNCTKLFYEAKVGERIKYLDVCSLYPYACKYGKFPVGHPEVLVGKDCPQDISQIDGLVKATLLPPPDLYHPVLPVRSHGKLMFPLCGKCAATLEQNDCQHTDEERHITGTWVADEINMALSKGYKIIKVFEVWKYETTQFRKATNDGGLFVKYINAFLKLKQEASGWPEWVKTEEDKDRYIVDFESHEGITLDKTQITKNPGFRAISKMQLNSFWGKFGQRNNLSKTTFVKRKEEITNLLTNPNIAVNDVMSVNEEILLTNWNEVEESSLVSPFTSVVIASYVTCIARLKLYSYLDLLKERILYFDTDSIIFVDRPELPSPETGDYLGDLTDELVDYGPGSYIDTFVSGGPKNYAYRVRKEGGPETTTVCKVKGINLHHKNIKLINFDKIKDMVLDSALPPVEMNGTKITRTKKMVVLTVPEKKTYRVVYTKRRRVEEFDTLPYGFKRARI